MTSRLTPKQERFVQALVSGASQREAYLTAYNCKRIKPETVDKRASELFKHGGVSGRYDELMSAIAAAVVWDRAKSVEVLVEIVETGRKHVRKSWSEDGRFPDRTAKEITSAAAELNKVCRIYDQPGEDDGRVTVIDDV